MKALVSIHDVMPETMDDVGDLIALCRRKGVDRLALLVVPGLDWQPDQLDRLRAWQGDGHELAAHGWKHRCEAIRTWKHRGHSLLLSRRAAEHLSLDAEQVSRLMDRSGAWFAQQGFAIPQLYVPPAWALGTVTPDQLRRKPFRMIETLSGLLFPHQNRRMRLPVVGFEADTTARQISLRVLNRASIALAIGAPVRISIHPRDHRLRLEADLASTLGKCSETLSYSDMLREVARGPAA